MLGAMDTNETEFADICETAGWAASLNTELQILLQKLHLTYI